MAAAASETKGMKYWHPQPCTTNDVFSRCRGPHANNNRGMQIDGQDVGYPHLSTLYVHLVESNERSTKLLLYYDNGAFCLDRRKIEVDMHAGATIAQMHAVVERYLLPGLNRLAGNHIGYKDDLWAHCPQVNAWYTESGLEPGVFIETWGRSSMMVCIVTRYHSYVTLKGDHYKQAIAALTVRSPTLDPLAHLTSTPVFTKEDLEQTKAAIVRIAKELMDDPNFAAWEDQDGYRISVQEKDREKEKNAKTATIRVTDPGLACPPL